MIKFESLQKDKILTPKKPIKSNICKCMDYYKTYYTNKDGERICNICDNPKE